MADKETETVVKGAGTRIAPVPPPAGKKQSARERGMVRLTHPISVNGMRVEELSVNIQSPPSGFTWGTLHELELEYPAVFPDYPVPVVYIGDAKYRAMIIARLNGLHYDDLKLLSPFDGLMLDNELGRFLTVQPLETREEKS
jgi:hypothetical protein